MDREIELLANAITECSYSDVGCQGFPVRMVGISGDTAGGDADASIVMLCADHEHEPLPLGEIIFDKKLTRSNPL